MAIADDFTINDSSRTIRHTSGSAVYTANQLYSFILNYFSTVESITSTIPISAQTPTQYSIINGWFIPESSFQYLNGGAIQTIGLDAAVSGTGVYIIRSSSTGYTNCSPSDIGLTVTNGVNTGILLDYNNSLQKWWVRSTLSTWTGTISVTGGTGIGAISTSVTGEELFANIYTLGALEPSTINNIYVEQVNTDLVNNTIQQYWLSGPIDIMIKVSEANTLINSGYVRVYVREYTDYYSHFNINLSAGGRNPVPLSTAADANNQTSSSTVATWNDVLTTFGLIYRDTGTSGLQPYGVEVDCGVRVSLNQVYERLKLVTSRNSGYTINAYPGQFYRNVSSSYPEIVTAPFGTFAGGKLFGAEGVWLKNVPAVDSNNYSLIDEGGITRVPPYASVGALVFSSDLVQGGTGYYTMYFTSGTYPYGTVNSVVVNDNNGVPISGVISSASIIFSFGYDSNNQNGRVVSTDTSVTIVAYNTGAARPTILTATLTKSTSISISITSQVETAYI